MVPPCLLILFVLLYGRATACRECGRWWARVESGTECLGRAEFEKDGVSWVRAKRRTDYSCKHCHSVWSEAYTDEYPGTVGQRPRKGRAT